MKLKQWLRIATAEQRAELWGNPIRRGRYVYFSQLANGHRKPSPRLALEIERISEGQVSRKELRGDIWE